MSQNVELESVKRRIKALLNKTVENGCTEKEAMSAATKVAELLNVFNLTMNEVDLAAQECVTKSFKTKKTREGVFYSWTGIQALCGLKVWRSVGYNYYDWRFFGLEQDVDMAIYLCELIEASLATSLEEFRQSETWTGYTGHRKILTSSFKKGFGNRVNDRLFDMAHANEMAEYEEHEKRMKEAAYIEEMSGETISKSTALISTAKSEKIEEEFKKLGMKLRTQSSYSNRSHTTARQAGNKAGSRVNLNRPIGGGSGGVAGYIT